MVHFNTFIEEVKTGTRTLAKDIFDGYEKEAIADAEAFFDKTHKDLDKWTKLLSQNKLDPEDFTDLVQAKKAVAEIRALRQTGVMMVKLEKFRTGLINLVIDNALKMFI